MTSINSKRKPIALNAENLRLLGGAVRIPGYERIGLPQNILHIGVGGFHRAHQAAYLDDLLRRPGFTSWGLCGIALLPQDKRIYETMQRQDCLYTLVERDNEGDRPRILGSIGNILFAPDDPQGVIEKMAAPETRRRLLHQSGKRGVRCNPSGYSPRSCASRSSCLCVRLSCRGSCAPEGARIWTVYPYVLR